MKPSKLLALVDYQLTHIHGRSIVAVAAALGGLMGVMVSFAGPTMLTSSSAATGFLVLTSFFSIVAGVAASGLAEELSSGTALFYLAQPIRRVHYVFSWLLTTCVGLALVYLASLVVPLAVYVPEVLGSRDIAVAVLLGVGQVLYHSLLGLDLALLLRRRGLTILLVMVYVLLCPFIASTMIALTLAVTGDTSLIAYVVGFFLPATTAVTGSGVVGIQEYGFAVAYGATLVLLAICYILARRLQL